jgi:hypothetical protein
MNVILPKILEINYKKLYDVIRKTRKLEEHFYTFSFLKSMKRVDIGEVVSACKSVCPHVSSPKLLNIFRSNLVSTFDDSH